MPEFYLKVHNRLLVTFSGIACCGAIANPSHTAGKKNAVQSPKITEIRLWNNVPGERILLRSDGTASYFGRDPRSSPGVGEYRGTYPPKEFQWLAETFNTQRFVQLKEQYPLHYAVGTALYSMTVVTDNQPEKLILIGSGRVPTVLSLLKSAIREVASKVVWQEGSSGVRGVLVMQNTEPLPKNATVEVQSFDGLFGSSNIAFPVDRQGRFEMPLPPGSYQLRPCLTMPHKLGYALFWDSSLVTVLPDKFTSFTLLCTPYLVPFGYRGE